MLAPLRFPRIVPMRSFFTLLFVIAVIAGVLRFSNLEDRVLWKDEAITLLHAAGHTESQFRNAIADGRIHAVYELRPYQGSGSSRPSAVVHSLALEDPQHPPLYYLMLFFWERAFGTSTLAERTLSALIGIALLPAMYWLCMELFESRRTAMIGMTMIATSPFFVVYSKQLREYELLALCTLVSGALLLRVIRYAKRSDATWYALSIAVGLYADLFFAIALAAQLIYLIVISSGTSRRVCLTSAIGGIALFVPWLAVMVSSAHAAISGDEWSAGAWPISMLAEKWVFNAGTTFFDLEYERLWLSVFLIPILLLVIYAIFWVSRYATRRQKWFIACLLIPNMLVFGGGDILFHAHRSAVTRYGVVFYLGLILCMAAMLGAKTMKGRAQIGWQAVTLWIAVSALACNIEESRTLVWWDNHEDDDTLPIAYRINAATDPLIIALAPPKMIYTLSFRLNDNVRLLFANGKHAPNVPASQHAFVVGTTDYESDYMKHMPNVRIDPLYTSSYNATWKAFHDPLKQSGALVDADGAKLSLWLLLQPYRSF